MIIKACFVVRKDKNNQLTSIVERSARKNRIRSLRYTLNILWGYNFTHLWLNVWDWSKSIVRGGGGGVGAFCNVVDKKHMAHPLPSAQN